MSKNGYTYENPSLGVAVAGTPAPILAVRNTANTEYIDIGKYYSPAVRIEIGIIPRSWASQKASAKFFGGLSGGYHWIGRSGNAGQWYAGLGGSDLGNVGTYTDEKYTVITHDYPNEIIQIDDQTPIEYIGAISTSAQTTKLFQQDGLDVDREFACDLLWFKWYDNGVLDRDLIAKPGGTLYDRVHGVTYTNDGGGSLTTVEVTI